MHRPRRRRIEEVDETPIPRKVRTPARLTEEETAGANSSKSFNSTAGGNSKVQDYGQQDADDKNRNRDRLSRRGNVPLSQARPGKAGWLQAHEPPSRMPKTKRHAAGSAIPRKRRRITDENTLEEFASSSPEKEPGIEPGRPSLGADIVQQIAGSETKTGDNLEIHTRLSSDEEEDDIPVRGNNLASRRRNARRRICPEDEDDGDVDAVNGLDRFRNSREPSQNIVAEADGTVEGTIPFTIEYEPESPVPICDDSQRISTSRRGSEDSKASKLEVRPVAGPGPEKKCVMLTDIINLHHHYSFCHVCGYSIDSLPGGGPGASGLPEEDLVHSVECCVSCLKVYHSVCLQLAFRATYRREFSCTHTVDWVSFDPERFNPTTGGKASGEPVAQKNASHPTSWERFVCPECHDLPLIRCVTFFRFGYWVNIAQTWKLREEDCDWADPTALVNSENPLPSIVNLRDVEIKPPDDVQYIGQIKPAPLLAMQKLSIGESAATGSSSERRTSLSNSKQEGKQIESKFPSTPNMLLTYQSNVAGLSGEMQGCGRCGLPSSRDAIAVMCDNCDREWHLKCWGGNQSDDIPWGTWLCPDCVCLQICATCCPSQHKSGSGEPEILDRKPEDLDRNVCGYEDGTQHETSQSSGPAMPKKRVISPLDFNDTAAELPFANRKKASMVSEPASFPEEGSIPSEDGRSVPAKSGAFMPTEDSVGAEDSVASYKWKLSKNTSFYHEGLLIRCVSCYLRYHPTCLGNAVPAHRLYARQDLLERYKLLFLDLVDHIAIDAQLESCDLTASESGSFQKVSSSLPFEKSYHSKAFWVFLTACGYPRAIDEPWCCPQCQATFGLQRVLGHRTWTDPFTVVDAENLLVDSRYRKWITRAILEEQPHKLLSGVSPENVRAQLRRGQRKPPQTSQVQILMKFHGLSYRSTQWMSADLFRTLYPARYRRWAVINNEKLGKTFATVPGPFKSSVNPLPAGCRSKDAAHVFDDETAPDDADEDGSIDEELFDEGEENFVDTFLSQWRRTCTSSASNLPPSNELPQTTEGHSVYSSNAPKPQIDKKRNTDTLVDSSQPCDQSARSYLLAMPEMVLFYHCFLPQQGTFFLHSLRPNTAVFKAEWLRPQRILDWRRCRRGTGQSELLIKWQGLPYEEASWEPAVTILGSEIQRMFIACNLLGDIIRLRPTSLRSLEVSATRHPLVPTDIFEVKDEEILPPLGTTWVKDQKFIAKTDNNDDVPTDENANISVAIGDSGTADADAAAVSVPASCKIESLEVRRKKAAAGKFVPYYSRPGFLRGKYLYDYQLAGVNWLRFSWYNRRSVILADEMGLGKTVQVASFLASLWIDEAVQGPFLVVAPLATLEDVWVRELQRWAPFLYIVCYYGNPDSRRICRETELFYNTDYSESTETEPHRNVSYADWMETCFAEDARREYDRARMRPRLPKPAGHGRFARFDVLITSYELLRKDDFLFQNIEWKVLVVDEGHRLKSFGSEAKRTIEMCNVRMKLLLTGTPLQNSIDELLSLLNVLHPEKFPEGCQRRYANGNVEDLKSELRLHILRRTKRDVLKGKMPPKHERLIVVNHTKKQREIYRNIILRNHNLLSQRVVRGEKKGMLITSLRNIVMQMRKCCNHPYLFEESIPAISTEEQLKEFVNASGKMQLLDRMLPMFQQGGHRVLIFSQFMKMLDLLESFIMYKQYGYERLDGSTPPSERQKAIDRFNAGANNSQASFIFLLSTRAGGLGINLTSADTVIIFDSDWNPHNDLQAQARAHRLGQTKTVAVYRFVTADSVEERIVQIAKQKLVLDQVVAGRLNPGEVHALVRSGAFQVFEDINTETRYDDRQIQQLLERNGFGDTNDEELNSGSPADNVLDAFKVVRFDERGDEVGSDSNAEQEVRDSKEFWNTVWEKAKLAEKKTHGPCGLDSSDTLLETATGPLGRGKRPRREAITLVTTVARQENSSGTRTIAPAAPAKNNADSLSKTECTPSAGETQQKRKAAFIDTPEKKKRKKHDRGAVHLILSCSSSNNIFSRWRFEGVAFEGATPTLASTVGSSPSPTASPDIKAGQEKTENHADDFEESASNIFSVMRAAKLFPNDLSVAFFKERRKLATNHKRLHNNSTENLKPEILKASTSPDANAASEVSSENAVSTKITRQSDFATGKLSSAPAGARSAVSQQEKPTLLIPSQRKSIDDATVAASVAATVLKMPGEGISSLKLIELHQLLAHQRCLLLRAGLRKDIVSTIPADSNSDFSVATSLETGKASNFTAKSCSEGIQQKTNRKGATRDETKDDVIYYFWNRYWSGKWLEAVCNVAFLPNSNGIRNSSLPITVVNNQTRFCMAPPHFATSSLVIMSLTPMTDAEQAQLIARSTAVSATLAENTAPYLLYQSRATRYCSGHLSPNSANEFEATGKLLTELADTGKFRSLSVPGPGILASSDQQECLVAKAGDALPRPEILASSDQQNFLVAKAGDALPGAGILASNDQQDCLVAKAGDALVEILQKGQVARKWAYPWSVVPLVLKMQTNHINALEVDEKVLDFDSTLSLAHEAVNMFFATMPCNS